MTRAMFVLAAMIGTANASPLGVNLGPRPEPASSVWQGCAPDGIDGDPALNVRKNRADVPESTNDATVAQILALPVGPSKRLRATWSKAQLAGVAQHEGAPVRVLGYLIGAKQEGAEATNCGDKAGHDFHLYFAATLADSKADSVIIEITPRLHWRTWTMPVLSGLVKQMTRVRVTGWLLYDQEHVGEIGKSRGTVWEIHPITSIEVWRGGRWATP